MSDSLLEKRHAPTPRRRQQARQRGQVAQSKDLTSAALLLAAIAALWFFGGVVAAQLATAISESISAPQVADFDIATASHSMVALAGRITIAIVPMLGVMMLVGIVANVAQTGFVLSPARLVPQLTNISPATGLKRICSVRGLANLGFGLFKVTAIMAVAYTAIQHYGDPVMNLPALSVPQIAKTLFECLLGTCLWIGLALFALALVDFGFQKWKFEQDLMMTDEQLREELKEIEGDPELMDRRRELQRTLAMGRTAGNLNGANVAILGSTGTSVVLKYDPKTMSAPTVVAADTTENIRQIAHRRNLPTIIQDLPEQVMSANSVGNSIPHELYESVARGLIAVQNARRDDTRDKV